MSSSDWVVLFTICVLGAYSPGPSQTMILSCVAKYGKAAGLHAATRHGFGVLLYAIASATGLSVLLLTLQLFFSLLIWQERLSFFLPLVFLVIPFVRLMNRHNSEISNRLIQC